MSLAMLCGRNMRVKKRIARRSDRSPLSMVCLQVSSSIQQGVCSFSMISCVDSSTSTCLILLDAYVNTFEVTFRSSSCIRSIFLKFPSSIMALNSSSFLLARSMDTRMFGKSFSYGFLHAVPPKAGVSRSRPILLSSIDSHRCAVLRGTSSACAKGLVYTSTPSQWRVRHRP